MGKFLKKYWLIILLAFLAAALVALRIFFGQREPKRLEPSPTPQVEFRLERVLPPRGAQEFTFPSRAIGFTFSKKVDIKTAEVTISPLVAHELSLDESGKTIFVKPVPAWTMGQEYLITLNISSEERDTLLSPIVHGFQPISPTESDLVE